MVKRQFYKNKYLIAFYDKEETCRYVFDNIRDMCECLEMNNGTAHSLVSKMVKGKHKSAKINNEYMSLELIEAI